VISWKCGSSNVTCIWVSGRQLACGLWRRVQQVLWQRCQLSEVLWRRLSPLPCVLWMSGRFLKTRRCPVMWKRWRVGRTTRRLRLCRERLTYWPN